MLDALLPLTCPGCGARGWPLCARCEADLRPPVPASPPPGIDAWSAAFAYRGAARELVARLKYRNARAAVPWLATAMVHSVLAAGLEAPAVTWAPTTPQRRRARGFDPAEILARAVARRLGVRCTRLLARQPGPPQTGLAAAARLVGPCFAARRAAPSRVLLVDDVATTGATLTAAAAALRAAGAQSVLAITGARTPPPPGAS
ncbi:MAG: phosphoribosyltransferase family protein [Acidimicrobiia bacterium]